MDRQLDGSGPATKEGEREERKKEGRGDGME